MDKIRIYFSEDTPLAEYEAVNKGYRADIFVEINEKIYNVRTYSIIRLQQDYERLRELTGFYYTDPNLIIVENTSKEEIIYTINRHYEGKYFDGIKPIDDFISEKLVQIQ